MLLILLCGIIFLIFFYYCTRTPTPERVISELKNARMIYKDTNNDYFTSYRHKIRAKPDFLYKLANGSIALVEYKSQRDSIRESDVSQVIAATLAVREKYPNLNIGFIYTRSGKVKCVDLNKSDEELINLISAELSIARQLENNMRPQFTPQKDKCRVCPYNMACSNRI